MKHDEGSLEKLASYCRDHEEQNLIGLATFQESTAKYHPIEAIWWCTYVAFLLRMLNQWFRFMEAATTFDMSSFIDDLYQKIDLIHREK
jgi:hypothetical protein